MEEYNIYCDESCHLENDNSPIMVLGAVWCSKEKKDNINQRIKEIKAKYDIFPHVELKWTNLSKSKYLCYEELVNYFFDDDDLHFRAIIVDNKKSFKKYITPDFDTLYYKMYFETLKIILTPNAKYYIYLDIKDTRSKEKVKKLYDVLNKSQIEYSFNKSIVSRIQVIDSADVQIMQLTDILIGAISYSLRNLSQVIAKNQLIELIQKKSHYSFTKNTLYKEEKFNLFHIQLYEDKPL